MKIKKMDYMAALAATALLLQCASCRHGSTASADEIPASDYPPHGKTIHPGTARNTRGFRFCR